MRMENVLLEFQQQNPDIYIGGSVALILQGIIPYRVPKDIDIISPKRIHIYDIFGVDKPQHKRLKKHRHNGFLFDLFIIVILHFVFKQSTQNSSFKNVISIYRIFYRWKITRQSTFPFA